MTSDPQPLASAPIVRPAEVSDLPELEQLIAEFVRTNRLLPRTYDELQDLIPFGFVATLDGRLVGFAALEIYSSKLAEIRSLAVVPELQGKGLGKKLVQECIHLAQNRNVLEVMAITSSDEFFRSCGFDFTLPGEKKALFIQTREQA
jgi:N-acetylglutamate synthase-like GNAT family acetyltransferase